MTHYNKLIRDKIPKIIEKQGKTTQTHVADEKEYREKLYEKLSEEAAELRSEPSLEEAADLQELFLAVCNFEGWTLEEIEKIRQAKYTERGGFEKRLILDSVS